MKLIERREFPCPECKAEIGELCISRTGYRMARFVHPSRGKDVASLTNILKLRQWLINYGDIFQEDA